MHQSASRDGTVAVLQLVRLEHCTNARLAASGDVERQLSGLDGEVGLLRALDVSATLVTYNVRVQHLCVSVVYGVVLC